MSRHLPPLSADIFQNRPPPPPLPHNSSLTFRHVVFSGAHLVCPPGWMVYRSVKLNTSYIKLNSLHSFSIFVYFLAMLCGMQDLSSLSRNRTHSPWIGSWTTREVPLLLHLQSHIGVSFETQLMFPCILTSPDRFTDCLLGVSMALGADPRHLLHCLVMFFSPGLPSHSVSAFRARPVDFLIFVSLCLALHDM